MMINKRLLILIIAICTCITTNAQIKRNGWYYITLPMNDSAEWCVADQDGSHKEPEWHFYRFYKTLGDTFISGQTYKKLWTNTYHRQYYPTDTLVCMFRQDTAARKVYVRSAYNYYPDTNEYLVMDFGVKDNDTLLLPVYTRKGNYEKRKFYVLGLDSQILIGSGSPSKIYYDRIKYQVRCIDTSGLVYNGRTFPMRDYTLLEGIGSDRSTGPFFYPMARKQYYYETDFTSRIVDTVRYLHCLASPDSLIWLFQSNPNNFYCYYIMSITPIGNKKQSLKMFPNPCNEYIDIQFDDAVPNLQIEFIDINGKQVIAPNKTMGNMVERVSTINLVPGIYIMRLYNNLGYSESYKLIRQ